MLVTATTAASNFIAPARASTKATSALTAPRAVTGASTDERKVADEKKVAEAKKLAEEKKAAGTEAEKKAPGEVDLDDPKIRAEITRLQNRDREVRAHEQAHLARAGRYATSGPSYGYTTGPDGQRYAVSGEVGIDTSAVPNDPQATIYKARQIRAAALAPAQPSGADLSIASAAAALEQRAQRELARAQQEATYQIDGAPGGAKPSSGSLISAIA